MAATTFRRTRALTCGWGAGFTLLEMMVVVGLISVMATLALPSIVALYNSGADAQAYNLIAAQLTAARAKAIVSGTYAGIHAQMADLRYEDVYGTTTEAGLLFRPDLEGVSYSCMIVYDSQKKTFDRMPNTKPERVPGTVGVGYASEPVTGTDRAGTACRLDGTITNNETSPFVGDDSTGAGNVSKFTTFSVIFNPLGAVTRFADGEPIRFDPNSPLFSGIVENNQTTRLWRLTNDYVQDRYGATAITLFDMAQYQAAKTAEDKLKFLNENARILPLNVHTGLLYERK